MNNLSKEDILNLYNTLNNEISSSEVDFFCNICKLPTKKSNRIILKCNHIYHYNCIKKNINKSIISCPYCSIKNIVNCYNCDYLKKNNEICCKPCFTESKMCNTHLNIINKKIDSNKNKIISNNENLSTSLNLIDNQLTDLTNVCNTNMEPGHTCNYDISDTKKCNYIVKNNNIYCKIHMKKINTNILKLNKKKDQLKLKYENLNNNFQEIIDKSNEIIV